MSSVTAAIASTLQSLMLTPDVNSLARVIVLKLAVVLLDLASIIRVARRRLQLPTLAATRIMETTGRSVVARRSAIP